MKSELRPHQIAAVAATRRSLASGKRRPMVQLPTGAGKTVIAAGIVEMAVAKGNPVAFVVPAVSLIDQTVERFAAEGIIDVGVIQANHHLNRPERMVQVCSEQTLVRRGMPQTPLVIVDEAHRKSAFLASQMQDEARHRTVWIGLSATPWSRGLGKLYDDLIIPTTMAELISQGWLSPFRVFAPSHPDLSAVRKVAGEFHEGDLGEAMNQDGLVADVVETWKARAEGRPTLVFAVDRTHAKTLQQRFEAAGVPAGYIDAYTDTVERKVIERRLAAGDISVVVNVGCLTTGVDWDVRCIVLARPTTSEMLHVQIIGRALRTAPGKIDALILDHADNHARLGFVTDIHHEELDGGKAKRATQREATAPLPKDCPSCSFLRPAKVRECPNCGFVPEPASAIQEADGELVELKADGSRGKAGRSKKPVVTREEKQRWWSGLLAIGRDRGYKPTWAAAKYKDRFGAWPRGLDDIPEPPALDILGWVKSQQIAYAKRRKPEVAHAAS